jgi:hypothetical protein
MNQSRNMSILSDRYITTEEMAEALAVKAQSIHKRWSQTGSFHGVVARRLPTRRLMWPAAAVEQLLAGGK